MGEYCIMLLVLNILLLIKLEEKTNFKFASLHNFTKSKNVIVAVMGSLFLFFNCEKIWADDECGKPKNKFVNCEDLPFSKNIRYIGYDGLTIKSTDVNISQTKNSDKQGIKISTGDGNQTYTKLMRLIWQSGHITVGDEETIGYNSSIKVGRYGDGLRIENKGQGGTELKFQDGQINIFGYNAIGIHGWQRRGDDSNYRNLDSGKININFSGLDSTVTTNGRYSHGILGRTNTGYGETVISANNGEITTNGKDSDGVRGQNDGRGDGAEGNISIDLSDVQVSTKGSKSRGITATNSASGDSTITIAASTVITKGQESHGIISQTKDGKASIIIKNISDVDTSANDSEGIFALAKGSKGTSSIVVDGSSITTTNHDSDAVVAQVDDNNKHSIINGNALVKILGENTNIETAGDNSAGVIAQTDIFHPHTTDYIFSQSSSSGDATVIMNNGKITTSGGRAPNSLHSDAAHGILAMATGGGEASITQKGGNIFTSGNDSHGIFSYAPYFKNNKTASIRQIAGTVQTAGIESYGLAVISQSGAAVVEQSSDATINTFGLGADSIAATGKDSVDISIAGTVSGGRLGGESIINSKEQHGVGIHVATGEFKLDKLTQLSSLSFSPNTNRVSIKIQSSGVVNALSDNAIDVDGGTATITNEGTITGTVSTWNKDDIFTNNAEWGIRNFQATSVVTKRDTVNVAVSDFGKGDDQFINRKNATVQLKTAALQRHGTLNHLTTDTDEYFPDHDDPIFLSKKLSISEAGIEQAHLVNLDIFENAGIITMADKETGGQKSVAGDVIVITSSAEAAALGTGRFISNGGEVHIDTVLNDGVVDWTDVLVLDTVELGTEATTLVVSNAYPDKGAATDINCNGEPDPDEGILVIQVRGNNTNSSNNAGAFVLKTPPTASGWEYELHQSNGHSWLLHSLVTEPISDINFYADSYQKGNGKVIGALNAVVTDNCSGQPITYSLVSGEGDTDNDKVKLLYNEIWFSDDSSGNNSASYKPDRFVSIRVQASINNMTFEKVLTIDMNTDAVFITQKEIDIAAADPKQIDRQNLDIAASKLIIGPLDQPVNIQTKNSDPVKSAFSVTNPIH